MRRCRSPQCAEWLLCGAAGSLGSLTGRCVALLQGDGGAGQWSEVQQDEGGLQADGKHQQLPGGGRSVRRVEDGSLPDC